MRKAATAALSAAALAAAIGMGGTALAAPGVSSADKAALTKAALTKAVNLIENSKDAAKTCGAGYTPALLKAMYGSKKQCEAFTDSAGPSSTVKLSSISVSGSSAKAKVAEKDKSQTISGSWQFTRSGKAWQVSLIGADFLRAGYSLVLGPRYDSGGSADPFNGKAYRACGLAKMLDRSDKAFLTLIYQFTSSRNVEMGKAFAPCTKKAPGGKSPFPQGAERRAPGKRRGWGHAPVHGDVRDPQAGLGRHGTDVRQHVPGWRRRPQLRLVQQEDRELQQHVREDHRRQGLGAGAAAPRPAAQPLT